MEIKSAMKKAMATTLVAASCILPTKASAVGGTCGFKGGDVGYVHSEKSENSYGQVNAFFKLPGDIGGYTWMNLYNDSDKGFFGKTTFSKEVFQGICARAVAVHANEALSEVGAGLEYSIPNLPKGLCAKLDIVPYWNSNGDHVDNKIEGGYFVSVNLPFDMNLSSFARINLGAEKGPQWSYGEAELTKKFGKTKIGYSAALNNAGEGKMVPKLEHRLAVRFDF